MFITAFMSTLDKSLLELLPCSLWISLLKRDSLPEPEPPEEASESVEACGGVAAAAMLMVAGGLSSLSWCVLHE